MEDQVVCSTPVVGQIVKIRSPKFEMQIWIVTLCDLTNRLAWNAELVFN